ncbi:ABC transporter permease [Humisphaera borealis]|uniref:ABC transporter permease n=1 Tax=Humisphaera borealis TaxID=2807512 RepID=A0A7M2WUM7_9BACT|nr:ABC transporter permease [Humisphaera borealis]QOV88240.1 ABC transporter permease [Humisphaera borealis]
MNLFQLILKQMRQRALSTWLTLLSVLLGTALATGILLLRHGGESLFVQKEYGYDVIVGSGRGSPLQLVLNTAYHLDKSPGNLPYWVYEELSIRPKGPPQAGRFDYFKHVRLAIPFARGDTYKSRPIIATSPKMFGFDEELNPIPVYKVDDNGKPTDEMSDSIFQIRPGERFELAEGRIFHPKKFEAVIGAEVARNLNLKIGSTMHATHGDSQDTGPEKEGEHHGEHDEHAHAEEWTIVGILKPTSTANDRCIYIPLISFYCIPAHDDAQKAQAAAQMGLRNTEAKPTQPANPYTIEKDGTINLATSSGKWQISGVLVKSRGGITPTNLMYHINNGGIPDAVAVNPASTMRDFFATFLKPSSQILLMISILVSVLAGVGILVSIYNSVSARNKEIAILRALGATKTKVLLLICLEAGFIGLVGGILGWMAGHAIGAVASNAMEKSVGQGFNWLRVGSEELLYLGLVVVIAVFAGLVPALKAYRTPVATNLVAG